jgi:dienelactone hydrolase
MPFANVSHRAMLGTVGIGVWVKRILGLVLALGICAGLWWLRPIPADPAALAVIDGTGGTPEESPAADESPGTEGGDDAPTPNDSAPAPEQPEAPPAAEDQSGPVPLIITQSRNVLEMRPAESAPSRGLLFFQGALIDPRAYAKILQPIAEAGYLVAILKAPFDLAIADIGGVSSVVDSHPDVEWWAIGGHSLGGVAAATFAAGSPRTTPALVLWASYPYSSLATVDGITVLSVSGTADGLATPSDVEASKANLPADTTYVAVEGAVHSYFGDYGEQRGDGTPTISREEAQQQIVAATLQWLNSTAGVA